MLLWEFQLSRSTNAGVGPHSNDFLESNYEWSIAGGRQSVSPVPPSPIAASPNAESSMPDARGATAPPGQARKAANPVFGVTRQSSVFGSLGRTVSLKVHLSPSDSSESPANSDSWEEKPFWLLLPFHTVLEPVRIQGPDQLRLFKSRTLVQNHRGLSPCK